MIDFIFGSVISVVSLLIGFSLGKNQSPIPPSIQQEVKKKYDEVMRKVAPPSDVGAVIRPTARERELRDNPRIAEEQTIMSETLQRAINS